MSKMRVYEYAKERNVSSKDLIAILKRLDVPVANHMSVIDEETLRKLDDYFKKASERKPGDKRRRRRRKRSGGMRTAEGQQAQQPQQTAQQGATHRDKPGEGAVAETVDKAGRNEGKKAGKPGEAAKEERASQQGAVAQEAERKPAAAVSETAKEEPTSVNEEELDDRFLDDDEMERRFKPKRTKPAPKRFDDSKPAGKGKKGKDTKKAEKAPEPKKPEKKTPEKIEISGDLTVGELAKKLNKEPAEIIKKLMALGILATINQTVDKDAIYLICEEYGVQVEEKVVIDELNFETIEEVDDPADLVERPPVVTIMGHVDHGKTTLLDAIRHANVAAQEAGGITQHIGAYQVEVNGKKITFLDTPGHEAFTAMRARGAKVTDITVLVVAADDGVMPQTVEAINHAKAAGVPIIVAVNKIDNPEANPDRVKQELTEHGLVPEEWGGDTIFVPISALKKQGIDELLEMILLVAEMQELKANPNKRARGTVIEAKLDRGRGPVATVLVQHGTLRVGDPIVVGNTYGRVRAMTNERGERLKEAGPSTPVEITGLNDVPSAGDAFMVFEDERKAREIGEARAERAREAERQASAKVNLDDLFKKIQEGDIKEINVIIKADVQGSVEALKGALGKMDVQGVRVNVIHAAVGAITESDVNLAAASNAIIIGFNVRPEPSARSAAEREKVDIRLHRIIYEVIDEIEAAMKGLLEPEYREVLVGRAEVRQVFKISKVGTVAGCYVTEGKVVRDGIARLVRDGVVIYEGKLESLKRFKDDVREVAQGYECGLTLENFQDIKEGDVIEVSRLEEASRA